MKLFRKILTLVTCSLMLNYSQAQVSPKFNFGVRGTLNFSTIGTQVAKYNGGSYYSAGVFGTYKVYKGITLAAEPTFTMSSFKERQADNQFTYSHLDFNLNSYFSLLKDDDVLKFYLGIRPGILLNFRSETLLNGNYVKSDLAANKNSNNQIDFGINTGFAIQLSPVVSFELGYLWSLSNQTDNSQIKGRNSLIEATIKLNAVDLKKLLDSKEVTIKAQVQQLRKGALLVMLPTVTEKELAKYSLEGDKQFVINELRLRNHRVITEFSKHFTFTPVYFFLDSSASKVSMGQVNGVFINKNQDPDTTIVLPTPNNYFIASFCSDLYGYSQRISYGLFVYDSKLNQLGKPFTVPAQMFGLYSDGDPANYFKTRKQNYTTMPFDRMVKKLNSRLIRSAEFDVQQ
jgi:hypothetical protein